jgi:ketosteroid isomerase-like protein
MSEENVGRFMKVIEAANRMDIPGVLQFMDPEVQCGVETELPFAVVARFRDGRMTHFTDYGDKVQALEAPGLSE